jgi:hypothetical protein
VKRFYLLLLFCGLTIYLNASTKKVESIVILGNKKTKSKIILRELTFQKGDSIALKDTSEHAVNSANNLFNTSLFNFSKVTFKDSLDNFLIFASYYKLGSDTFGNNGLMFQILLTIVFIIIAVFEISLLPAMVTISLIAGRIVHLNNFSPIALTILAVVAILVTWLIKRYR